MSWKSRRESQRDTNLGKNLDDSCSLVRVSCVRNCKRGFSSQWERLANSQQWNWDFRKLICQQCDWSGRLTIPLEPPVSKVVLEGLDCSSWDLGWPSNYLTQQDDKRVFRPCSCDGCLLTVTHRGWRLPGPLIPHSYYCAYSLQAVKHVPFT